MELRLALLREEVIEGLTIAQWANVINTTADRLVDTVTGKQKRWGNTLDAYLLARALNLPFRIVDGDTFETLMSNHDGKAPLRTIVWKHSHFYVLQKMKQYPTGSPRTYGSKGYSSASSPRESLHGDLHGYSSASSSNGSLHGDLQGYSFGSSSRAKLNDTPMIVAENQRPQKSDFLVGNATSDNPWRVCCSEQNTGYSLASSSSNLAMREGAGRVNHQDSTPPFATSTSSTWNPNHRPYPFSPLFSKVIAHPSHDLARLIEATAFHTAKARDPRERKAFEQKLLSQDTNPEIAAFIDPAHLYHEYYVASVTWHQELLRNGATTTNPLEKDCVITSVSTVQPPQAAPLLQLNAKKGALASKQIAAAAKLAAAPKAMPKRTTLPLHRAVSAVARRRAQLTPNAAVQPAAAPTVINLDDALVTTSATTSLKPPLARKGAASLKPPLARKGAARKAQLKQRPPLPRRGKAAKQTITLVDATTAVEQKWMAPLSRWDSSEHAQGGIMKVPVPNTGGISQFYRVTQQPLAALLGMHISLVARRGLDNEVRIYYKRDKDPNCPMPIRAVTIEENADLRKVLAEVRRFVDYVYLEASIQGPSISYILNFWTDKGRLAQDALLATLHSALVFASSRTAHCALSSTTALPSLPLGDISSSIHPAFLDGAAAGNADATEHILGEKPGSC
eukprot:3728576-Amphidinium_carterae.1